MKLEKHDVSPFKFCFDENQPLATTTRDHVQSQVAKEAELGQRRTNLGSDFGFVEPQEWVSERKSSVPGREGGGGAGAGDVVGKSEGKGSSSFGEEFNPINAIRTRLLEAGMGSDGVMPRRAELRAAGRRDIEDMISQAGGFVQVASVLGWRQKGKTKNRRPRGYWSDFVNVRREVEEFIFENSLDPALMPTRRQFERAGRYDIARLLRSTPGGSSGLAKRLGLRYDPYRGPHRVGNPRESSAKTRAKGGKQ